MRWTGHVACIRAEKRNAYTILSEKLKGKTIGRLNHWTGIKWDGVNWIYFDKDKRLVAGSSEHSNNPFAL
jgi:hypothetical protein